MASGSRINGQRCARKSYNDLIHMSASSKTSELAKHNNVKQLASEMARQLERLDQGDEDKPAAEIGKLDINKFIVNPDSSNLEKQTFADDIRKGYCSEMIEQLEKGNNEEKTQETNLLQRKIKLVQIDVPKSVEDALAALKEKNEQKWQWKQKMVGELDKLIKANYDYEKEIKTNKKLAVESTPQKDPNHISELDDSRKRLKDANEKREKEFEECMKELEAFSEAPSNFEDDEEFQSGIKAYLDIVEEEKSETSMSNWIKEFQEKVTKEQKNSDKTMDDLERRRALLKEASKQKYDMEAMNDKCEILMEYCSKSEVRDETVNKQAAYTNLFTTMQSLVNRSEQSMSDHTGFTRAKEEFEEWYSIALGTVQDSSNPTGNAKDVKQRTELIKNVSSRMTEGQHLLNCTSENFSKVLSTLGEPHQTAMKNDLTTIKQNYDALNMLITNQLSVMKAAVQRWDVYYDTIREISTWLSDTEFYNKELPDSKGQLGEMKTTMQKSKYLLGEIKKKQAALANLKKEARELANEAEDESVYKEYSSVEENLTKFGKHCQLVMDSVEKEMAEATMMEVVEATMVEVEEEVEVKK